MRTFPAAEIVLLALALRVPFVLWGARAPLADDAIFFEQHAQAITAAIEVLRTQGWAAASVPLRQAIDGASMQGVVYPLLLALVYAPLGVQHQAVTMIQAVLGALSCGLLALAGRAVLGRSAGLLAGLLLALYGPAITTNSLLLAETVLVFVLVVALWALTTGLLGRESRPGRLLLAGLLVGVLMLRPAFQYGGIIIGIGLLAAALRLRDSLWRTVLPYMVGVLIIAVPWVTLNGTVYGSWTWSRTGDAWSQVYWGIYPPNRGWWPPDSPVPPRLGITSLPLAWANGATIQPTQGDYIAAAWDVVRLTPYKALTVMVNKAVHLAWYPFNPYRDRPPLAWLTERPLHRALWLLALPGLCALIARPAAFAVLGSVLLTAILPFAASHIDVRYGIPPAPLAALLAAYAVVLAGRGIRAVPGRALAAAAVLAVTALGVVLTQVPVLVQLRPEVLPEVAHSIHVGAIDVAWAAVGLLLAVLWWPSLGRAALLAGGLSSGALIAITTIQGTGGANWHRWTVRLTPLQPALRQTVRFPAGWRLPAGAWAYIRFYAQAGPAADYDLVVRVDGREVHRYRPRMEDGGTPTYRAEIGQAAVLQGRTRADLPQWYSVLLPAATLDQIVANGAASLELVLVPPGGTQADAWRRAQRGTWVQVWGDYMPAQATRRVYHGPSVYAPINETDWSMKKFLATGEYALLREVPLLGPPAEACRRAILPPGRTSGAPAATTWQCDDLSSAWGRQTGEYRLRLLVLQPGNQIAALL